MDTVWYIGLCQTHTHKFFSLSHRHTYTLSFSLSFSLSLWSVLCSRCIRNPHIFFPPPHLQFSHSIFPSLRSVPSPIKTLWFCPASQSFTQLRHFKEPPPFPGGAPAKSRSETAHWRLPCYQQGVACLKFRSSSAAEGDFKGSHGAPVIPVSMLVSGIDKGSVHLGPR